MLSVRLDKETEDFLQALSEETHRPKSFFVKQALKNYQADLADLYETQVRNNAADQNFITSEEFKKVLGL